MKIQRFRSNPFSTRFVQPGALPFLYPAEVDASVLVSKFFAQGGRGAIVGPHGSGKSTLLASLLPEFGRQGHPPSLHSLHDGQRRLPAGLAAAENGIIVIDGYEQLSRLSRWLLAWRCCQHRWGLLVTSHRPVNLPILFETHPTVELTMAIVERLLREDGITLTQADITDAFRRADGNIRETLFDLYDRYDRLKSTEPSPVSRVLMV